MTSCIAKIELENLTYTIPGGFNAAPYSTKLDLWELPRAQSFKGLWRWWLRVLLSGALWESGKLNEEKIRQISENFLGSTSQASKFIIHISAKGKAEPVKTQAIGEWRRLRRQLTTRPSDLFKGFPTSPSLPSLPPRLFLLLRAREINERLAEKISCYSPGNLKITIELLKRPFMTISSEQSSVAVSSFLLSLIFGGVGAITRRGFGSLSFISIELYNDLQKYECIIDKIKKIDEPSNIRSLLTELIQESLSDARKLLGVKSSVSSSGIPDYPLLSVPGDPPRIPLKPFNLNIFKLEISNITSNEKKAFQLLGFKDYETIKLLTMIGYSTMKLFWKLAEGKEFNAPGSPYETWIMGLPRGQKIDKQELQVPYFDIDLYEDGNHVGKMRWNTLKTGYSLNDRDRRTATISIKPIKRLEKNSWIIALHGFLSKDWYNALYHYSVTPPPKRGKKDYQVRRQRLAPSRDVSRAFVEAWIKLKKVYGVE